MPRGFRQIYNKIPSKVAVQDSSVFIEYIGNHYPIELHDNGIRRGSYENKVKALEWYESSFLILSHFYWTFYLISIGLDILLILDLNCCLYYPFTTLSFQETLYASIPRDTCNPPAGPFTQPSTKTLDTF